MPLNDCDSFKSDEAGQKHITDREYWAGKRGQERREKAAEVGSDDTFPKASTKFRTGAGKAAQGHRSNKRPEHLR